MMAHGKLSNQDNMLTHLFHVQLVLLVYSDVLSSLKVELGNVAQSWNVETVKLNFVKLC